MAENPSSGIQRGALDAAEQRVTEIHSAETVHPTQTMPRLRRLLWPAFLQTFVRLGLLYASRPGRVVLAGVCLALAVGFGLMVPWLLRNVLDDGLAQRRMDVLYGVGALLVVLTVLRGIAAYGQSYLCAWLAHTMAYQLRNRLYEQYQRLSFAYHDHTPTGELMSRATSDVEAIRLFFQFGLPTAVHLVLTGMGTLLAMAWLDWRLLGLACASVPCFLAVPLVIGRLLQVVQRRGQECTAALTVALQESLAGIRVVKAFAREQQQTASFVDAATALYEARIQVAAREALSFPLLTLILGCLVALALYSGGQQVIVGAMSVGTLVAATGFLVQLALPLRRLSWMTGMASLCQAGGERLFAVLDTTPSVQDAPCARAFPHLQGAVCFEGVSFHYDRHTEVLHDVSFTVQPGQVIALVGSTGSGKSTIAQLIPRFYDVTEGRITLDGIDIRTLQLHALRQHIGIVMQEAFLFSTTIRDNIAYGREDLPLDTIITAAKATRAHDFIMQFPEGYDTWVGERGVTLSGGQRQRVAMARVFARNPRLLILDDATSSVDMETEFLIQQALSALMAGRTTFIIAQRLRTLKHADRILVLDQGRLAQSGHHDELVRQPGLYRRIYDLQLRDQEDFVTTLAPTTLPIAGLDTAVRTFGQR